MVLEASKAVSECDSPKGKRGGYRPGAGRLKGEKPGKRLWIPGPLVKRVERLLNAPSLAEPEADWQGWSLGRADRVNLIKACVALSQVMRHCRDPRLREAIERIEAVMRE